MTLSQVYPALFTMMSRPPKYSRVAFTNCCGNLACVTSPASEVQRPPASRIAASVADAGSGSRSLTMTAAPEPASFSAMARPIPRPAPVTRATLDASVNAMNLSQQIFKLNLCVGAIVPIFYDQGRVDGYAPFFAGTT